MFTCRNSGVCELIKEVNTHFYTRVHFHLSLQGSIQQLVIKDDPRAAEEQCEDDDPYVRNTHMHVVRRPACVCCVF